jgi:hypothetical protein
MRNKLKVVLATTMILSVPLSGLAAGSKPVDPVKAVEDPVANKLRENVKKEKERNSETGIKAKAGALDDAEIQHIAEEVEKIKGAKNLDRAELEKIKLDVIKLMEDKNLSNLVAILHEMDPDNAVELIGGIAQQKNSPNALKAFIVLNDKVGEIRFRDPNKSASEVLEEAFNSSENKELLIDKTTTFKKFMDNLRACFKALFKPT